jgi:hypothetical protein
MIRPHWHLAALTLAGLLVMSGVSHAQVENRTFGTNTTVHTIQAFAFLPESNAPGWEASGGTISCPGANCNFRAPVSLPAGALVTSMEMEICDNDNLNQVYVEFFRLTAPNGSLDSLGIVLSGLAATPGCTLMPLTLPTPVTIENRNHSYYVRAVMGPTNSITLSAVRLSYTLQVSPAPATATFGDVPTSHPFFRFVEALVASGITAGCGGGNYCPDAPLTRGQMATFLSKALGLHFAP